jgi:hypothetical protein
MEGVKTLARLFLYFKPFAPQHKDVYTMKAKLEKNTGVFFGIFD